MTSAALPLRTVATAFLQRRPFVVAPMFAAVFLALVVGRAPRAQITAVAGALTLALGAFAWESWRGRRRVVTERWLFTSLALTLLGIGLASAVTGGRQSPVLVMAFAPTVIGFAAFGRGRASDVLCALAVAVFAALSLLPAGVPFAPPPVGRAVLLVICAADALILLRLGVAALTDAHGAARAAAARAGDEAVASATARNAALEAMGAKVAHEVRNPLSAIRGLIEVLAEKSPDQRDHRRLSVMLCEVDRIDEILTGYLSLARPLDQVQPRPTDIDALLREVATIVEARVERAHLVLTVEAAATAPVVVDPRRLKEALLNLLLNAIDASAAGGTIQLRASRTRDTLTLSVADAGTGMDPARLAQAGTPFATGRAGGTGLGLALARQAAAQHGGELVLNSAPGRGTLAEMRLPLVPPLTAEVPS